MSRKFKNNRIPEIEINTANTCTAKCIMCSRQHGSGNVPLMMPKVFNELVRQLRDVDFDQMQTSGNGETFLNPYYLDYIETIRREFPGKEVHTYNNFSMWDKERSDRIIKGRLFDKIHVRIDSLHKWIFERNSNLNKDLVFKNLIYFLKNNTEIPVVILYNDIVHYYNYCKEVTGNRPTNDLYKDEELALIKDEEQDIVDYFSQYAKCNLTSFTIGHSLWAERNNVKPDGEYPCPMLKIINKCIWVHPDGRTSCSSYDDRQDDLVCGDIMKEHILDIYYGDKRKELLDGIAERKYKGYPCVNPRCCLMKPHPKYDNKGVEID